MVVLAEPEFLPPGARLGRYEIVRELACGGMAEIYLARTAGIGGFEKLVVLKRMLPQYARSASYRTMFLDEARVAASLDHGNIVQTFDIGVEGDCYFFTMEYVRGADARALMRRCWRAGVELPLPHALKIVIDAAAGLHAAHETMGPDGLPAGIVHRDVSPSNILVSDAGCVKLIDFGVVKAARRQTETRSGEVKGKASYMSPEQCNADEVDRRSDVFSLGIVLYELTTGRRLFTGKSEYAIMDDVAKVRVTPPSARDAAYPAELERIVMTCLQRDPALRYQTAQELLLALEQFARTHEVPLSAVALGRFVGEGFEAAVRRAHGRPAAPVRATTGPTVKEISWTSAETAPFLVAVGEADVVSEEDVVDITELLVSKPQTEIKRVVEPVRSPSDEPSWPRPANGTPPSRPRIQSTPPRAHRRAATVRGLPEDAPAPARVARELSPVLRWARGLDY